MKAWTDYPFVELGDTPHQKAPIREVEVLGYDGDRYCDIIVEDIQLSVKRGYLYQRYGRYGDVPQIETDQI